MEGESSDLADSSVTQKGPGPVVPRVLAVMAWPWLLVAISGLTDVDSSLWTFLLLDGSGLLLALAWLGLPLVVPSSLATRAGKLSYASAALAGCIALTLDYTDLGLVVRVAISEPQLVTYIGGVAPGAHNVLHEPRRVGLFLIDGTEEYQGTVLLYAGSSYLNRHGVAFIPLGKSPPPWRRGYRHLYGPWHSFVWRF